MPSHSPCSLLLLPLLLAACGSYAGLAPGETRAVDVAAPEPPPPYRVQPGDTLAIAFAHHATRTSTVTVRLDGKLSIPFAEEVHVAGLTVPEADDEITKRVASQLRDPDLTITVVSMAQSQVFVGGEVARPMAVPLVPGMTAFQALTASGGITPNGAKDSVILVRANGPGKRIVRRLSVDGADMLSQDVALGPFDILFVPTTSVADVGTFVNSYVNAIIPHAVNFSAFYNLRPGL